MIYRVNTSRALLWATVAVAVTIAVAVAMMVGCSIGLTNALPQPHGQAQGNATMISNKGLIQALEGNYSGALSL